MTKEENERKDRKVLSHIHLHLSNQILQDILKEKTVDALWIKLEELCLTKIKQLIVGPKAQGDSLFVRGRPQEKNYGEK